MDIIIRSQDKCDLFKATELHVSDNNIYGRSDSCNLWGYVGTYPTKERCIEIINDIYNEVIRRASDGDSVVIYSMPKE